MNQTQPQVQTEPQSTTTTVKPSADQSKLNKANEEINQELSSAANSSANQQVAQASGDVTIVASNSAGTSLPQSA